MTQVDCYYSKGRKAWTVRDRKSRKVIGDARRVLLRDVTFKASPVAQVIRGTLEAAEWGQDQWSMRPSQALSEWDNCKRSNNAYHAFLLNRGTFVTSDPERFEGFQSMDVSGPETVYTPIHSAPMAVLVPTALRGRKRGSIYAGDPCQMTEAESLAATE